MGYLRKNEIKPATTTILGYNVGAVRPPPQAYGARTKRPDKTCKANPHTFINLKVRKIAMISNRYNQVPHLSQDTKWECNKITINITNKIQEVSPFP